MEEPLLLLLRPYIQTSIVEPFALETKQKEKEFKVQLFMIQRWF